MFNSFMEAAVTFAFSWSFLMTAWMLVNMVPRMDVWNWRGLVQDVSVVGFVAVLMFLFGSISVRRWLELSPVVTAIAICVVAITLTPIAYRVHKRARGK